MVSTPIGNLRDMTFRAVEILQSVDIIAAEDTRTSKKLLNHYQISTDCISYHDKNEQFRANELIESLHNGSSVAVITDAGTPCISDPGYRIVNAAHRENITVITIPGPSSVTAALSISGLPTDHYYFEGFLPRKKGRKTHLEFLANLPATIVIFESPHRIVKTLENVKLYMGSRWVSVGRELTKKFEECFFGVIDDAISYFSSKKNKGEFVIMVAKSGYSIDD